ncbi:WD40 repeat domain-containing protein [Streptomyces sp. KMM 9044]|uniref:WD40 repeat domain-containing protein n=1 Tax=Streptomyces sp. KMM 9044 TaxID=2744474 RepID=UPI002F3F0E86
MVEEELRAGFRGGVGVPLGLGELEVEGVDVLRRPTRPPASRRRLTTSCTKTLTSHTGEVHSVAVSPDGTRLATSNMDR